MKRRHFLQTSAAAAAGLNSPALRGQEDSKQPNLLIIHCDELNFRTLGCYRDTLPPEQALMWGPDAVCETPQIDSIAKRGAICTKFYAATPVCSPSRSSFISGQYPQNTPVTTNNVALNDGVITFGHLLGKAGYATGYAGKWHLDGSGKPQWKPERAFGFDDNRFMFNRGHWKQFEFDPDELTNFIAEADQGATLKRLAIALKRYAIERVDTYAKHPHTGKVLADLAL